jgi:hypothetical protein
MRPAVEGAVYVIWHVAEDGPAEDRVHAEELLKLPPTPPSLHVRVPVGALGELPLVSMTVAVNTIGFPARTEEGFGRRLVVVACREEDAPGRIASAITPKSHPCEVPNDIVAEVNGFEAIWYCAYAVWPAVLDWISVSPLPPVWTVYPVSPPNWKTKSGLLVVVTPVLQGRDPAQTMFAWRAGSDGLVSKGLAVFAPETPKAITPYQVSPVMVVWTEMTSPVSADGAIAYHVCMNWSPPMLSWAVLGTKVRPAVSFTEKAPSAGQQLQPTMITSEACAVVRETEHAVT